MKRIWIGAALLAFLLAVGLWTGERMEKAYTEVARQLRLCGEAALGEQWDQARQQADQARAQWEEQWDFAAALADHTALDEIDGVFQQLQVCLDSRDALCSAALCARLAQMVDALQEAHKLTWRNLL